MSFNRKVTIQNRIPLLWNIMFLGAYMKYNPRKIVGDKNQVCRIQLHFCKSKIKSKFLFVYT